MVDLDSLDDQEVEMLIKNHKNFVNLELKQELYSSINVLFGKIDFTTNVIDNDININYKIKVYRGKRDTNRYSIHIRFDDAHHTVVRIDIGAHHNEIKEGHIHIYNKNCEPRSNNVFPISKSNFPAPSDIIDAVDKFLEYNHIE